MSTSVIDLKKRDLKASFVYFLISLFCIFFNFIYSKYSHEVKSAYMYLMFLYPLLLGALVFTVFVFAKIPKMNRLSFNIYNSGIATLTVGSCLHGIFIIAGTASSYQSVYTYIGISLIIFAFITYAFSCIKEKHTQNN